MFGFSKETKLSNEIGELLHGNIREALINNEAEAGLRISDMFSSAFIYSFITSLAEIRGYDGDKFQGKHLKNICHGILPQTLYDSVLKNSAAIEMLENAEGDFAKQQRALFFRGVEAGSSDARVYQENSNSSIKLQLFFYLINSQDRDEEPGQDEEPNLGKLAMFLTNLLDSIWSHWPDSDSGQEAERRKHFVRYRYGLVDRITQNLSLEEEQFFKFLEVTQELQEFQATKEELEDLVTECEASQISGEWSEWIFRGGAAGAFLRSFEDIPKIHVDAQAFSMSRTLGELISSEDDVSPKIVENPSISSDSEYGSLQINTATEPSPEKPLSVLRAKEPSDRNTPEEYYAIAYSELESGDQEAGLWAKIYAHSEDDEAARKEYIRERANALHQESVHRLIEKAEKQATEQREKEAALLEQLPILLTQVKNDDYAVELGDTDKGLPWRIRKLPFGNFKEFSSEIGFVTHLSELNNPNQPHLGTTGEEDEQ